MNKISCKLCGKCCILPNGKDCKHLVRLQSGKTLCRVYKTRLGRKIGEQVINGIKMDVRCFKREEVKQNYEGCPYNDWWLNEDYKKDC